MRYNMDGKHEDGKNGEIKVESAGTKNALPSCM